MEKIIISAVSRNGIIGDANGIPWHSKEDFKHFKQTTMGYPLIMGRKTFESMNGPLKGRLSIVLTRDDGYKVDHEDVKVFAGIDEAYKFCESQNYAKVFISGGGQIYNSEINNVDTLLISEMKLTVEGDVYFPEIDEKIWKLDSTVPYNDFILKTYVKR